MNEPSGSMTPPSTTVHPTHGTMPVPPLPAVLPEPTPAPPDPTPTPVDPPPAPAEPPFPVLPPPEPDSPPPVYPGPPTVPLPHPKNTSKNAVGQVERAFMLISRSTTPGTEVQ